MNYLVCGKHVTRFMIVRTCDNLSVVLSGDWPQSSVEGTFLAIHILTHRNGDTISHITPRQRFKLRKILLTCTAWSLSPFTIVISWEVYGWFWPLVYAVTGLWDHLLVMLKCYCIWNGSSNGCGFRRWRREKRRSNGVYALFFIRNILTSLGLHVS